MTLIKTSLLNAIAVIIKMLTLLGINKVLAVYVGPSGYAAIGQFQNAVQMITAFSSGAINTGVTKYTAEYQGDIELTRRLWKTAGMIVICASTAVALLVAIFCVPLARYFLNDVTLSGVFLWFAATLVLFTFNALLLAILNGKKEIHSYVLANIAGSIFSLAVTVLMTMYYKLYGALVALAIYQSISFFVTLAICGRKPWFRVKDMIGRIDGTIALNLSKFTAMALTSAACLPLTSILIRNTLGEHFGWDSAGYWEAMWRLSTAYLMLVTTTLGVYYLPKLSELKASTDIRAEIINGYKYILPVAVIIGVSVYVLKDFIISVLFTPDFYPMRDLFAWQLTGDTLKIGSWIIGYLMISKAMIRLYIVSEIICALVFVASVKFFTVVLGFQGAAVGYAFTYFLYWLVMGSIVWKRIDRLES